METVQTALWVVVMLVILAVAFDFMNGFHDAANSIATVVSTGVLKPGQAVLFAATFNFVAIFVFHLSVAATVGKGIVQPGIVDTHVVFGALDLPQNVRQKWTPSHRRQHFWEVGYRIPQASPQSPSQNHRSCLHISCPLYLGLINHLKDCDSLRQKTT